MTYVSEGVPVRLMQFRKEAAVGVMSWGTLLTLVPDPGREESAPALRSDRKLREHAELRNAVQRLLKNTTKGKNVGPYAAYIAAGLRGDLERAWSVPPVCLWSSRPLSPVDGVASLPLGVPIVAIDGETQVAAMHAIMNDPAAYDLDQAEVGKTPVAFEIYWDIDTADARQIFHDRNLFGVAVAKTLALSMDQRDFGTEIARRVEAITSVEVDGRGESLAHYVNGRKRQLAQTDHEWITLSALRSLAVTILLGKPGIEATSGTIDQDDLPSGVDAETALNEVAKIASRLISSFTSEFARRSALTAPAVLAGVGAAAHRTTSWTRDEPRLTTDQLHTLLSQVHWDREEKYWGGLAAKRTATGNLSFAGGAKDSGHRVCDAILNPDSESGRRIRGRG
jgi:hypothetical protein